MYMDISVLDRYKNYNEIELQQQYDLKMKNFKHKIIILDDDPTGVQKVHGVHVYTDWSESSILDGFQSNEQMFFILTNSRSFSEEKTIEVYKEITETVERISEQSNLPYLLISRSDSTLRGHYPLETEVIHDTMKRSVEGEIMIPFFREGGRYTIENVHYVEINGELVPTAETEFAKDRTFGFSKSHLGEYIEEKTSGAFKKEEMVYIQLDDLRELRIEKIVNQLINVCDFNKVIVNAISDNDLKVFMIALIKAIHYGKRFLFRTAATFTKVVGNIPDKSLLNIDEIVQKNNPAGGLIIVGSHVKKTTQQLKELLKLKHVAPIEFNSDLVLNEEKFKEEIQYCIRELDEKLGKGETCVIYTKRNRLDLGEGMAEKELMLSVQISIGLTQIIEALTCKPRYIIAKGGITSSEIGAKALHVKKALVMGQVLPGIPVWKTDEDSKYPNIAYIIFPGNVGKITDLYHIVKELC
ncbi:four-carbon acid sugar kinase family protein [Oceanobacillus sp. FSL K6-0118]|uniref:four-carbon acid sugar kinase family protein n=1 Tax=Oceanobacillus sp. FSL K6-0118 TaxID=2921418 RepID=UPI00404697BC